MEKQSAIFRDISENWFDYFLGFALIVYLILFILLLIKEGFPLP